MTENARDETMYRIIALTVKKRCVDCSYISHVCDFSTTQSTKLLKMVYYLSSVTTAERYLRSMNYTREPGEKCVISSDEECDVLLVRRLQMNILTHATMKGEGFFDKVSQYFNIPKDILTKCVTEREPVLEELKKEAECIPYSGRSEDNGESQHVTWPWRDGIEAKHDIVRSCVGLHPHFDIYILNNRAYRKHSKYHEHPPDVRSCLYSLLLIDGYMGKINDKSYDDVLKKIRQKYFPDLANADIQWRNLPEDTIRTEGDVIAFQSDDIRHNVMYAFITECLVKENDLKFFLTTASCHVISEYCRSFWYESREGERCLFLPEWSQQMYEELFIDKLQLDILTHCVELDEKLQDWISERLKVPREILRWDYAARRRYKEFAKKGTQTMHRARAMIVGCAGAGKSTLLKRLQKRSLEELKQIQSTRGLEVHEDVFEFFSESSYLTGLPAGIGKEGRKLLSILDFGGQCAYYACHQVYLSRRAFYLLVINMLKKFDEKVDPLLCEQEGTMFTDWTYGEYLLFWLNSVHTYCGNDAQVIIVGTHLDEAKDKSSHKLYENILDFLKHDQHLKKHLARERCFVLGFKSDGSSFADALSGLEERIVSIANQPRWTESIPEDWVTFEVVLRQLKEDGKKIVPVKTLSQLCFGDNKEKSKQISDVLRFYHDIGVLLHFDAGSLSKNVILDIQWFVDSFKNIITDPNHFVELVENTDDWDAFNDNGHISDDLLTKIWTSQQFKIEPDVKASLLQYMERLGLIYIGRQAHYIPCMNKLTFGSDEEEYLRSIKNQTSVLVFRFHFLPYFIFFRLIVACLTKTNSGEWTILEDKGLRLFKNVACFLYKYHTVVLAVHKHSIQLQIFQPNNEEIKKDVTLKVRGDVERLLKELADNFHKKIVYTSGYQCSKQEVFHEYDDCFIEEEKIHGKEKIPCPKHGMLNHHELKESTLLYHWNADVRAEPTENMPPERKSLAQVANPTKKSKKAAVPTKNTDVDTADVLPQTAKTQPFQPPTALPMVGPQVVTVDADPLEPGTSADTWNGGVSADGTVLSESDMSKFTKVMGKDYEVIARYLQLSQNEIDIIKMENAHISMPTVMHKIFLKWRSKLGHSATLEILEKSLQDAESESGAGLDWEVFIRAKEGILNSRGLKSKTNESRL